MSTPPLDAASVSRKVPARYLALFIMLYAIQGVVFAFFANFIQKYMQVSGVSADATGLVLFLVLLPFAFKFLAAPISDRFNLLGLGHRKPYILIGLIVQAVGLVVLSRLDPGRSLVGFASVALLTVAGLALYDTCADGMIVDITPPRDRPRVQGLLVFSRFFTATITTLAFGTWLERTGTGPGLGYGVLWACAGLTIVPLLLGSVLPEPRRALDAEEFNWSALKVMIQPRSLALIAFGTFYALVAWGVEINLPIYYDRLGYGQQDVGIFGSAKTLGRALGALALPLGARWFGRRKVLTIAVLALVCTEGAQALVGPQSPWTAGLLGFAFGAANGWTEALFYVLAMEASDPRMAASTFALFMAVSNLSVMGSWLFIKAVGVFGAFAPAFLASAMLTALALLLVGPLSRPKPEPLAESAHV